MRGQGRTVDEVPDLTVRDLQHQGMPPIEALLDRGSLLIVGPGGLTVGLPAFITSVDPECPQPPFGRYSKSSSLYAGSRLLASGEIVKKVSTAASPSGPDVGASANFTRAA